VVVSEGFHRQFGAAHAEVDALQHLNGQAKGATVYVTLEPCCHWGKTPPCTDHLINSGVTEVFYGFEDPDFRVAGKSETILRQAGISCQQKTLPEINNFYRSYAHWNRTGKPWVTAKLAMSLDGKIAGPGGQPVSITGPAVGKFTHEQRYQTDAILTTAVTVMRDNPKLNARLGNEQYAKPVFILDSELNLPEDLQIYTTAKSISVFCRSDIDEIKIREFTNKGVNCIPVEWNANGLDMDQVLREIGKQGIHDLWVEAGGRCLQSLLTGGLLNRGYFYISPKWLGRSALTAFQDNVSLFTNAKSVQWQVAGSDVICQIMW